MTEPTRQQQLEDTFRELLRSADLPQPDDSAHLDRAVVFLWYESKAFVLVDLDEVPADEEPFAGMDLVALEDDIRGRPSDIPLPFTGLG